MSSSSTSSRSNRHHHLDLPVLCHELHRQEEQSYFSTSNSRTTTQTTKQRRTEIQTDEERERKTQRERDREKKRPSLCLKNWFSMKSLTNQTSAAQSVQISALGSRRHCGRCAIHHRQNTLSALTHRLKIITPPLEPEDLPAGWRTPPHPPQSPPTPQRKIHLSTCD